MGDEGYLIRRCLFFSSTLFFSSKQSEYMSPGNKSSGKAKDRVTLNCARRERRILIFFRLFSANCGCACVPLRNNGGGGRATYLERSSSRCILCALLRRCITVSFFIATTQKNGLFGNWLLLVSGDKGIYSCVQNSSNLFHDKEDEWQNSTNTVFFSTSKLASLSQM